MRPRSSGSTAGWKRRTCAASSPILPFLSALITHPKVRANKIDTGFIERELKSADAGSAGAPGDLELWPRPSPPFSAKRQRLPGRRAFAVATVRLDAGGPACSGCSCSAHGQDAEKVTLALRQRAFDAHRSENARFAFASTPSDDGGFDLTLDGVKSHIVAVVEGHELYLRTRNGRFDLHWVDPFGGETEEQAGEDKIVAPLPGTVVALLAEVGATLEKGAPILTLEVMKMEQTLRAPFAGVLKAIKCKVGDIVQEGVELAEVEPIGA